MERKVIYRDRQEFQAADINNTQNFVDESLQHIITDAITSERQIVGLQVSAKSATEIEVAPGRLWAGDEGKVYRLDEPRTISIFSYLPLQDMKWLAVSVYGQEEEIDIQPRDFLIDLQTGQTEPQAVPMERVRKVIIHITSGLESPDPQKPEPPTGYTLIAYVLLSPSGIQKIEFAENKILPRLSNVDTRVKSLENWKNITEPRVSTLSSDMAILSKKIEEINLGRLEEIISDIVKLKEFLQLPDTYSSYGADYFMTEDETDKEDPEYYAKIHEGLTFPDANKAQIVLNLFNPYETKVKNFNGLILPDFDNELRIKTTKFAGSIAIGQYQYQTYTFQKLTISRNRFICSPLRIYYPISRWASHPEPVKAFLSSMLLKDDEKTSEILENIQRYYGHKSLYQIVDLQVVDYYRKFNFKDTYWKVITQTEQINGSQIAQTFLCSQNGWLTQIGLYFTQKSTDGVVYLHLTKTKDGKPDLTQTIGSASVSPADIKIYPSVTIFQLDKPVLLEAGERYAFVLTTAGNHKIATVSGETFTEGVIFYSTDGLYFQEDPTKDLMMELYFAKFKSSYVTVDLQPVSLSGGIAEIELLTSSILPQSTNIIFEYQKDGKWYPIDDSGAISLTGLPAMLPLKVTFIGSSDIMPAVNLADSVLTVSRPATTMKHISTTRSLPSAATEIKVILLINNWDSTKHSCSVKIRSGGTDYSPQSYTDIAIGNRQIKRTFIFNFSNPISNYKIIIEGSTTTPLNIFRVLERIDIAI